MAVVPGGTADVYDIVCADPHRNFVANGIIVHNCGKTASIVHAHDPIEGPLVVLCPKMVRYVWVEWINKRFGDWDEHGVMLTGRRYDRERVQDKKYVILNYDIAPAWQSMGGRRIGTLVLDEAHLISRWRARRAQAAVLLTAVANRVVCATGTPLWNRPEGLHSILSIATPGAFDKWFPFTERYCAGHPGTHGYVADGVSRTEEFRARLAEIMLRRTWQDVQAHLPATERAVETAELPQGERFQIDLLAEQARGVLARKRVHVGELARYRRVVGLCKVEPAIDCARRFLGGGEPVVLWTWHKDVARRIATTIHAHADAGEAQHQPAFLITGDTPHPGKVLDVWRAAPPAALVITLAVGQSGIDLSHARHAVFAELDWTPAVVAQAEMRTFSPARPGTVTYIAVDHDVDRALAEALHEKCKLAQVIGTPAAETALDVISAAFGMGRVSGADARGDLTRLVQDVLATAGAVTSEGED